MSDRSPCVELCQFDGKTGLCLGCLRTKAECLWSAKIQSRKGRRERVFAMVLGEYAVAIVQQIFVTPFELGGLA